MLLLKVNLRGQNARVLRTPKPETKLRLGPIWLPLYSEACRLKGTLHAGGFPFQKTECDPAGSLKHPHSVRVSRDGMPTDFNKLCLAAIQRSRSSTAKTIGLFPQACQKRHIWSCRNLPLGAARRHTRIPRSTR